MRDRLRVTSFESPFFGQIVLIQPCCGILSISCIAQPEQRSADVRVIDRLEVVIGPMRHKLRVIILHNSTLGVFTRLI